MKFPGVDDYTFKARLSPGLLALFPVAVLLLALGIRDNPVVSAILSFLTAAGGAFVLANVVRKNGLAVEQSLLEQWGGMPTTESLRWSTETGETSDNHATIAKAAAVELPTSAEEAVDPKAADIAYGNAIDVVKARTRDSKFNLLRQEDMNYGFARNLLGIRMVGLVISLAVAAVLAVLLLVDDAGGPEPLELGIGCIACVIAAGVWMVVPTADWVHTTANKYRAALYDAARQLNASA